MAKINLFYLSPNTTGGWVTFTAHLIDALKAAGHEPVLRKIGNNTERKSREFGYGKWYFNTSEGDAYQLALDGEKCLIVAAAKKFKDITEELLSLGAHIVIHDPTEFNNVNPLAIKAERCVVIRKVGLEHVDGATFIRHPYTRQAQEGAVDFRTTVAIATSRIDFDKHTDLLLDANRLLEADKKIVIRGFENRLYTKFKIVPKYPEWEQSKAHYPRTKEAAFELLEDACYLVDMSIIKGDGGGTQYTFLEAWDAGCVPIVHSEWLREGDDMVLSYNCLSAGNGQQIADILGGYSDFIEADRLSLAANGRESLKKHDPLLIGSQYAQFLGL